MRALLCLVACLSLTGPTQAAPPNIILILSDDMGYSDLGCYGGEINTPNLDRLAKHGLRFTQFYNTARCCPTRASLLTGLYPHQAGVGHMMEDRGHDGYRGDLNRQCVTIAEVLGQSGYATYMTGKWHLTRHAGPEGPKHNWPLQRGFQKFYGTITGAGSFYDPSTLTRQNTPISPFADPEYQPETYYYTHALSDQAVQFINEHGGKQAQSRPFFLYVAYTAAHWPMHALPQDVAKYQGRYDAGYQAVRQARFEKMKQLGVIAPDAKLSPPARQWEDVENREWEIRCMEVYAAMIDSMDQGIGKIVAALEQQGQLDNTLMFFLQDNGGCAEELGRKPRNEHTSRPEKPLFPPMTAGEIQKIMAPPQTRDGFPVIMGPGALPGPADTFIAYGEGWANVSNTPHREYKHWVHEGGISTPLIVHWPEAVKRRGELEHQPGHLIDIMATCVEVAGATYPQEFQGERIKPLEGRSLAPAFQGKQIERDAIYWEHEGNRAVRQGDWKLVAKGEKGNWELYNIAADRSELRDLAAEKPELVKELAAKWQTYAERASVLPLNPQNAANKTTFSRKKQFRLKAGDILPRGEAPHIANRGLAITATVTTQGQDGVIVAQGGSAEGYALYVRDQRLVFALRRNGKLHLATVSAALPAEQVTIQVKLLSNGQLTVQTGDKQTIQAELPGSLTKMPVDGLQVGQDLGGVVGGYDGPYPFGGKIQEVVITLQDGSGTP